MNSFAHYSFGAVYQWMVENIGGIRSDGPGYRRILFAPQFDAGLTYARVGYDSVRGPIRSVWKRDGETMEWDVTIPANTTATLMLPTTDPASIKESDEPLEGSPYVKLLRSDNGTTVLEAESGRYSFTFRPRFAAGESR
jgi:alpha-L-rhamnosidase